MLRAQQNDACVYLDFAEVVIAPTSLHIARAQQKLQNKGIEISAQNAWVKGNGAYTGEIRQDHDPCLAASLASEDEHIIAIKPQFRCGPTISLGT